MLMNKFNILFLSFFYLKKNHVFACIFIHCVFSVVDTTQILHVVFFQVSLDVLLNFFS